MRHPVHVGTANGRAIIADACRLGELVPVTLLATYEPEHPPGFPTRGSPGREVDRTPGFLAGTRHSFLEPEAHALVAAGAATYGAAIAVTGADGQRGYIAADELFQAIRDEVMAAIMPIATAVASIVADVVRELR